MIIVSLLAITVCFVICAIKEKSNTMNTLSDDGIIDDSDKNYDEFYMTNVSMTKKNNDITLFSLAAGKIIHRKRSSKLFTYQNIKEIFVSSADMDIYLYNQPSSKLFDRNSIIFDNIKSLFTSFGKSSITSEENLYKRVSDSDLNIMSRVVFENITMRVHLSKDKKISITSMYAIMSAGMENIIFSGDVKIINSENREIHSSKAVLLKKYNGFYFPYGYFLAGRQYKRKTLYTINQQREFLKSLSTPTIE